MSEADRAEDFAERIRERTGVDVDASDVRYQDGRAMLTDEGAAKIERAREGDDGQRVSVPRLDPTTERAIVGYTGALGFGGYAAVVASAGSLSSAVVPALLGLLGASLGRYYQTAERV